ncbi:DNA-3-methyladenine glycosylase 2 family protein [Microbacterium sp. JB110]|uniref:DNA-3-methyladenine glycosylase 2 family protein n=1 Tax=Microbacterium sp. JB110 TaxID=2024477 RepID=UPI00097F5DC6|nr:AlkA N-terminal domain-containing protein [Microbacterium sp. JB110]RCS60504.1 DNA-3-methyladenine glycosylase 2 family protein [Microbacterium sp. JB110]SJM46694.1 Methylated-DNA--protein-cysteine methyltransferase [Frigoribacterium sp. JB110]
MLTTATFDERFRAIAARDPRFDGQFVTAVRSTGIYCKPSCPARTPKPSNVSFYPTSAAAHEAGYRACKRCLPEAAPGSPEWNLRGDAASRAMRLIADGVVEREGVAGLGAALGYSTRHLSRLLRAELGAGPLALARAHRAQTARSLLVDTNMPVTSVAFSAGFASVRQFNDTILELFGVSPSDLRAQRRLEAARTAAAAAGEPAATVHLTLPVREPFDAGTLFDWMAVRRVGGMEEAGPRSYARTLRLPRGVAWFRVSAQEDSPGVLRLEAHLHHMADLGVLVARVRRLLDLDADPAAIDQALAAHAEIAPLVARVPGIRVPGTVDPHEMLIRAMIGQQISVAAARTHLTGLVHALGDRLEIAGEERLVFPTMAAIAARGTEVLRGPAARVRAIVSAAESVATGETSLTGADDGADQRGTLMAMRGIGPWTADYVRMRVLNDPDVFLSGDVALRAGAASAGLPADAKPLQSWAARAAPWRSYLCAHLWRAASDQHTTRRTS